MTHYPLLGHKYRAVAAPSRTAYLISVPPDGMDYVSRHIHEAYSNINGCAITHGMLKHLYASIVEDCKTLHGRLPFSSGKPRPMETVSLVATKTGYAIRTERATFMEATLLKQVKLRYSDRSNLVAHPIVRKQASVMIDRYHQARRILMDEGYITARECAELLGCKEKDVREAFRRQSDRYCNYNPNKHNKWKQ